LVASIVRDFELDLASIVIRPFDDGRFVVKLDDERIFDKERTGKFPKYEDEIKPRLEARAQA
jgi:predicted Rdx family selenoprotein